MESKISVVVPIYNMEELIYRCMSTLLNQSYKNYEIILVDDGSTDNSPLMCDNYKAENSDFVKCIHKKNGGLCSARNAGIEAATGEYVVFPDPDDWVDYDYLESFAVLIDEYQCDMPCCGFVVEYDDKTNNETSIQKMQFCSASEAQLLLLNNPELGGFAWNKLYRTDIIRDNALLFLEDAGVLEDLDFAFRYLEYCDKVAFNPQKKVYHYYQRPGAATNNTFSQKKVDALRTYEKIIEKADNDSILEIAKAALCDYSVNLLWMYKSSDSKDRKAYKRIRRCLKENLHVFLKSDYSDKGRKVQAVLALISPNIYVFLKNKIQKSGS